MTYQTEFPDFPAADMPAIPAGFEDFSWHNDACPCFINDDLGISIFIDYADKARSEMPSSPRFTVYMTKSDQIVDDDYLATDDWAAVLAHIEARRGSSDDLRCAVCGKETNDESGVCGGCER